MSTAHLNKNFITHTKNTILVGQNALLSPLFSRHCAKNEKENYKFMLIIIYVSIYFYRPPSPIDYALVMLLHAMACLSLRGTIKMQQHPNLFAHISLVSFAEQCNGSKSHNSNGTVTSQ
jgi:hypothetical protein